MLLVTIRAVSDIGVKGGWLSLENAFGVCMTGDAVHVLNTSSGGVARHAITGKMGMRLRKRTGVGEYAKTRGIVPKQCEESSDHRCDNHRGYQDFLQVSHRIPKCHSA